MQPIRWAVGELYRNEDGELLAILIVDQWTDGAVLLTEGEKNIANNLSCRGEDLLKT